MHTMPVTMKVEEVKDILQIGRNKVYELIEIAYKDTSGKYFRVVKIGQQYRIVRKSFEVWLYGEYAKRYHGYQDE